MSALGIMVLWTWIRREVLNKRMLWCFILAEVIFWSPCIVGAILGTIVNKWFWTVCTAYIGLYDVDSVNFPNLALMKISAYHKQQGDHVEMLYTSRMEYDYRSGLPTV